MDDSRQSVNETREVVPDGAPGDRPRRNFLLSLGSLVFGGLAVLVPFGIGLVTFLDPLRRRNRVPRFYRGENTAGDGQFVHICSLDALAVDGPPQRYPVIADKVDAWNYVPNQPIGAVFAQRTGAEQVRVFNTTCPHAGCSVSTDGQRFHCPCHNSSFNLNGSIRESAAGRENPSPRPLDELEVDQERLAQGEVWVRFQNFYTGRAEKIPKS